MKQVIFSILSLVFLCGCMQDKTTKLRVSSFNIRQDTPVDKENSWKYRKERVCDYIKKYNFDVIGLQEVKHNQLVDLNVGLTDYEYVGVGRDDGKTGGEYSPIYFKSDKYNLLDSNTFWLSEYPDSIGLMGWDAVCPRIATWARLEEKETAKKFIVINTHLDHIGKIAQQESAKLILKKVYGIGYNDPVILTGDFNITESDKTYNLLTKKLIDTYKISEEFSGASTSFHDFSRIPESERVKIDYVFVSSGIKVLKCDIPIENPNEHISDHNPYYSDLEF